MNIHMDAIPAPTLTSEASIYFTDPPSGYCAHYLHLTRSMHCWPHQHPLPHLRVLFPLLACPRSPTPQLHRHCGPFQEASESGIDQAARASLARSADFGVASAQRCTLAAPCADIYLVHRELKFFHTPALPGTFVCELSVWGRAQLAPVASWHTSTPHAPLTCKATNQQAQQQQQPQKHRAA